MGHQLSSPSQDKGTHGRPQWVQWRGGFRAELWLAEDVGEFHLEDHIEILLLFFFFF